MKNSLRLLEAIVFIQCVVYALAAYSYFSDGRIAWGMMWVVVTVISAAIFGSLMTFEVDDE